MSNVTFVLENGEELSVHAESGSSLMQAAVNAGVPGVDGLCGGCLSCATCRVGIPQEWQALLPAASADEGEMLGFFDAAPPEMRLSCQLTMNESLAGIRLLVPTRRD